jgi:hypothetical protein
MVFPNLELLAAVKYITVGPFRAWDYGIDMGSLEGKQIGDNLIWPIAGNIGYDLLVAAGILTVFIMIWGGIQYMISSGNDQKMTKARDTLTGGMIGAIISICAARIVGFLLESIGNTSGVGTDVNGMIAGALGAVYFVVGATAVITIIYSGFLYIAAGGREEKVKKAKTQLTWAIAGFVIAIAAGMLTSFIIGSI